MRISELKQTNGDASRTDALQVLDTLLKQESILTQQFALQVAQSTLLLLQSAAQPISNTVFDNLLIVLEQWLLDHGITMGSIGERQTRSPPRRERGNNNDGILCNTEKQDEEAHI